MSKMLDEIREQPAVLERTLADGLRGAERLRKVLRKQSPRLISSRGPGNFRQRG